MELVRFSHVSFGYPGLPYLLSHFDFSIQHGNYYYLTGENGVGKTTFLKLIYGAEVPILGNVYTFGANTKTLTEKELSMLRQNIGLIFQDNKLISHLSIVENVALPLQILGEYKKTALEEAKNILDWVELKCDYHKKCHEISDGQKKRVCIARSIVTKPLLILADEPTANLDIFQSRKVMQILEMLNEAGTPIICVTHHRNIINWFPHPEIRLEKGILFFEDEIHRQKVFY